jgi:CubicO group peptidase (beta-lactamase class C family)
MNPVFATLATPAVGTLRRLDRPGIMILALAEFVALSDTVVLQRRPPAEVGMDGDRLVLIDRAVKQGLAAGGFPGAAVVVGRGGAIVWEKGYGSADWGFGMPPVDARATMYDIASITKVVATSAAAMVLYDRGKLKLDAPVGRYLPEFRRGDKARVTVRDLLTHRSGLPAGRDLGSARNAREARRLVLATPLLAPPGTRTEYSDVGADVLGFVVEAIAGERLDAFVNRTIYKRLGLRNMVFLPSRDRRPRIAPTENHPPRGYPLRGEVHDEAAFALGGVAGHAGLFATASDLAVFAQMMLNGGAYRGVRIVSDSTVARFTERSAGSRALGWDTCIGGGSCGHHLGPRAYGHTGYTGTSLWIDPDRQAFVIVLSNWVHAAPSARVAPIAVLADVRSDIADIVALSITDSSAGTLPMPDRLRSDRQIGWRRENYGTR